MASTRRYDINNMNSGGFVKTFRKEKPKLNNSTRAEDCDRLTESVIKSVQVALEQSTPKFNSENNNKARTNLFRIPRNVSDLFIISKSLLNESRRQYYQTSNYERPNYSKKQFFEQQLSYYIGDQCSNKRVYKKFSKPTTNQVDENLIKDIINKSPTNKLPGLDYIPNEVWQCILKYDEEYLIEFINNLIEALHFPAAFKQGKLIVFRKPNRSGYHPENYRFITIQSTICKIFEKLIVHKLRDQDLMGYLNRVNNQHGFTRNKSRYSAINVIVDEMKSVKSRKQYGVLIQLDLSRAFDLISFDHIMKVAEANLDAEKVVLIAEILKNRTIRLNDYERQTHRGLPQGSPSSHLLWLIATSDLMLSLSSVANLTSAGFVDDFMLLVKGFSINEVLIKVNEVKSILESWLKSAALQLNENKCFYMQFSGNSKINLDKIQINRVKLQKTNELKYLGVHLNRDLDFYSMVNNIQKRIKDASRAVRTIISYRQQPLTYENKLFIYERAIKPIFTNGYSIWASEILGRKNLTDKLRNAQKRCLVVLFEESDYIRNSELCRKHKILPIDIELQLKLCIKLGGDQKKRRLTKKEIDFLKLKLLQDNDFHW